MNTLIDKSYFEGPIKKYIRLEGGVIPKTAYENVLGEEDLFKDRAYA